MTRTPLPESTVLAVAERMDDGWTGEGGVTIEEDYDFPSCGLGTVSGEGYGSGMSPANGNGVGGGYCDTDINSDRGGTGDGGGADCWGDSDGRGDGSGCEEGYGEDTGTGDGEGYRNLRSSLEELPC